MENSLTIDVLVGLILKNLWKLDMTPFNLHPKMGTGVPKTGFFYYCWRKEPGT